VLTADAADVAHLASLSRLTHLDLGYARGVVALAPRLPNLQSLALHVPRSDFLVSATLLSCRSPVVNIAKSPRACYCLAIMYLHGSLKLRCTLRTCSDLC
jgi:hypothetical protein